MIIPMTDDERRLTEEYLYLVPEMVKKLTSRCAYVSYDEQQDLLQAGNLACSLRQSCHTKCHLQLLEKTAKRTKIHLFHVCIFRI